MGLNAVKIQFWPMCYGMSLKIPYSGNGAKSTTKGEPLSPEEREKTKKTPDLTGGGNSNVIAHGPIV